ncbi:diacylglycerol kinase family protein [Chengkuizengella axinellae]|uniref:Diacylglycerol kinase family protein n=1 Tax=Chengkuizengella axinellae TaxID=3064388 RepID=A0ABT9IUR4_9BACL|nr:diacylglycerol kinase family protein [Chengkuizengella sp. 2205SS18-9]MDP5273098.1 diacylglycerol kinase family protein [Chengkuizengella sp. 2205SS18-9]
MTRWFQSFRYAYEGLVYAYSTQKNMRFHFFAGVIALMLALYFELSYLEVLFICLVTCLVIVMELLNTAIEKTIDLTTQEVHPLAKIAKDVAAAAVLVTAVFAVIVGIVIFYHPIRLWIAGEFVKPHELSVIRIIVVLNLVFLCIMIIQHSILKKIKVIEINIISALNASALTFVILTDVTSIQILLTCFISVLVAIGLIGQKKVKLNSILLGSFFGMVMTMFIYFLV